MAVTISSRFQNPKDQGIQTNNSVCHLFCETWTVTLRVESNLQMFENEVIRKTF
jgi:hypothetical protein